jgi:hypothetical protein
MHKSLFVSFRPLGSKHVTEIKYCMSVTQLLVYFKGTSLFFEGLLL